jgi:hypothetical protein
MVSEHFRGEKLKIERSASGAAALAPSTSDLLSGPIDKSQLTIAEPKRLRDKAHLKFVASQPCLICGREPSDPHHLRFAQPRALGLKVSDEFTVPLCRGHHGQLHQAGNELNWWKGFNLEPLVAAEAIWQKSMAVKVSQQSDDMTKYDNSLPPKADSLVALRCPLGACVDGSELARAFFTFAALVGAAMCSAC